MQLIVNQQRYLKSLQKKLKSPFSILLPELISGAELELVEGAGHLLQEDAPNDVAAIVDNWLARQR